MMGGKGFRFYEFRPNIPSFHNSSSSGVTLLDGVFNEVGGAVEV
jgi:hypothetical protein